jgi:hypothetical protein
MITHWFFEMAVAFRAKRILDRIKGGLKNSKTFSIM